LRFKLGRNCTAGDAMNNLRITLLAIIAVAATTLALVSAADARCFRNCRYHPWVRSYWGYGGLVRTWGLGGPADAPWVGGAITGVTPYAPYPYDHVRGL
jgi:hypothetical protein